MKHRVTLSHAEVTKAVVAYLESVLTEHPEPEEAKLSVEKDTSEAFEIQIEWES